MFLYSLSHLNAATLVKPAISAFDIDQYESACGVAFICIYLSFGRLFGWAEVHPNHHQADDSNWIQYAWFLFQCRWRSRVNKREMFGSATMTSWRTDIFRISISLDFVRGGTHCNRYVLYSFMFSQKLRVELKLYGGIGVFRRFVFARSSRMRT